MIFHFINIIMNFMHILKTNKKNQIIVREGIIQDDTFFFLIKKKNKNLPLISIPHSYIHIIFIFVNFTHTFCILLSYLLTIYYASDISQNYCFFYSRQ